MKITLVVTNPSGKNLVFLTNSLHALSLAETIGKAKTNSFDNLFVVNGTYGEYLAAKEFDIDPYLLGAILIDENVRMSPFEEIQDKFLLQLLGRNVSVGVAQVRLETANGLIKNELYNPNPDDAKLPFSGNLRKADREYLYEYVVQPKHNIRFATARIRGLIKEWSKYIDISGMPEILGTLYHRSYVVPHAHPDPNDRGTQIADEFYPLANKWLYENE